MQIMQESLAYLWVDFQVNSFKTKKNLFSFESKFPIFFLQIFTTSSNIRNRSNTSETSDIGDTSDTSDTRGTRDTSDTSDTSGASDKSDTSERGNHFPADKIGFCGHFLH